MSSSIVVIEVPRAENETGISSACRASSSEGISEHSQ